MGRGVGVETRMYLVSLLPNLGMSPREDLGVKVTVPLAGHCLGVGLTTDLDLGRRTVKMSADRTGQEKEKGPETRKTTEGISRVASTLR